MRIMKRKDFLKGSLLGLAGLAVGPEALKGMKIKAETSTYDKLMEQVGFNHLPNKEIRDMKSVLHKANTRGHANHGWLDSNHTFSFANYHNPERMHFGVLRVLNDDTIAPGTGFGTHPHDNMEIVSIPLSGGLEHKDSMGNTAVIKAGEVQVMSAGNGIFHSEYNHSKEEQGSFLQIWMFPNKRNVEPRYDQIVVPEQENELIQVLSPNENDEGVWVHQNAWFHKGNLKAGKSLRYDLKQSGNGIYNFLISGKVEVNGQELESRDGYGIWDVNGMDLEVLEDSELLVMEVPMNLR